MKIHFIGIGGIGMSALARWFKSEGHDVGGSDLTSSPLIGSLIESGIEVKVGEASTENIAPSVEWVIYSPAISAENVELQKAREMGIKSQSYPEALGEMSKRYFTLAVTGSHGKSTTTSILGLMLVEAGLDPTVVVGTNLAEFGGSNFRKGESKYLVIEADDFNRSFYNYTPQIAVVTNVDEEHLDTYKDIEGVIDGFNTFLKALPEDSRAVLNKEDPYTNRISEGVKAQIHYFSEEDLKKWPLKIPGKFNQLNVEAAWRAAELVGVSRFEAEEAVRKYKGSWRRLEEVEPKTGTPKGSVFYCDYGHHPAEVEVTLGALKEKYPDQKLTIVFQPHQGRRLTALFDRFTKAFVDADKIILLPVYKVAGRDDEGGRTSEDLKEALNMTGRTNTVLATDINEALDRLEGGVVVFMGAGDIDGQVRVHFRSKLINTPT